MKKIVLICLSLISCTNQDKNILNEKIGDASKLIEDAKTVQIEDINPSREGYTFTGSGRELSPSELETLKKLILDDRSYEFSRMKSCLFIPKTALHFKSDSHTVTVLYSPWCKQFKIQETILEIDPINDKIENLLEPGIK